MTVTKGFLKLDLTCRMKGSKKVTEVQDLLKKSNFQQITEEKFIKSDNELLTKGEQCLDYRLTFGGPDLLIVEPEEEEEEKED